MPCMGGSEEYSKHVRAPVSWIRPGTHQGSTAAIKLSIIMETSVWSPSWPASLCSRSSYICIVEPIYLMQPIHTLLYHCSFDHCLWPLYLVNLFSGLVLPGLPG